MREITKEDCTECGPLLVRSYLGGCSYRDEEDFKAGGYYEDMVNECVQELNVQREELEKILGG